jgi:hypothetical protein
MTRLLLFLAIGIVVVLIVLRLTRTRRRELTAYGRKEVEAALLNVLTIDAGTHDEWDYFLSRPIADPYLESVRQRCLDICRRYPDGAPGKDLPEAASAEVRALLEELRAR